MTLTLDWLNSCQQVFIETVGLRLCRFNLKEVQNLH